MTVHAYRGARYVTTIVLQDVVMVLAFGIGLWQSGPLATALALAAPATLAWGIATLHFPSRIEVDERGVSFSRYGRTHRFAWRDVTAVKVRRFLVKDRVLVRIAPSSAWRGRYWILDSITGFDTLINTLESRQPSS